MEAVLPYVSCNQRVRWGMAFQTSEDVNGPRDLATLTCSGHEESSNETGSFQATIQASDPTSPRTAAYGSF